MKNSQGDISMNSRNYKVSVDQVDGSQSKDSSVGSVPRDVTDSQISKQPGQSPEASGTDISVEKLKFRTLDQIYSSSAF